MVGELQPLDVPQKVGAVVDCGNKGVNVMGDADEAVTVAVADYTETGCFNRIVRPEVGE